jgi:hypothetical protein
MAPNRKMIYCIPRILTLSKTTSLAEVRALIIRTHLVASYDHAELNGGCNSDASTSKGNPSVTKGRAIGNITLQ